MDGRCKSLKSNRYTQVFINKAYFSCIYLMNSKKKAGNTLRLFCQEFGIPEKHTLDSSKEQTQRNTTFMIQIGIIINYHIPEADLHNQNPVEGVLRKWYRIILKKRILLQV